MSIEIRTGLTELAERANAEHRACETALQAGLQHAINAGELLIEAKSLCAHGEWLPWLQEHFEGTPRLAQGYMRVAREYPALMDANTSGVSHLSYREALRELAETETDEPVHTDTPPPGDANPHRALLETAQQYPYLRAWLEKNPRHRYIQMILAEIWDLAPGIDFTPVGITPGSIPDDLPFETWEKILGLLFSLPARWDDES